MTLDDPTSPKHISPSTAPIPPPPEPPKPAPAPAAAVAAPIPPQIEDFDELIKGDVRNFVELGEKVGGLVAEQVRLGSVPLNAVATFVDSFNSPKRCCRLSKLSGHTFTLRPRLRSLSISRRSS